MRCDIGVRICFNLAHKKIRVAYGRTYFLYNENMKGFEGGDASGKTKTQHRYI